MADLSSLDAIVKRRIAETEDEMLETISYARAGIARRAETDTDRREAAIERNLRVPQPVASIFADATATPQPEVQPEAIQGPTIDFVPVAYMERGLQVARAVARIAVNRKAKGTGFLCSNHLFVTNNHVIGSPQDAALHQVQFNYEINLDGSERSPTVFRLAPEQFFFTDGVHGLDLTIVAVGERVTGHEPLESFGWCGLSDSGTKHALGDYVTIIQHPRGRHKEVVLRENLIAGRHALALHYVADTEPGSSGSPVFNSDWQPVALHHWGGTHAWPGDGAYLPNAVNEGIRISRIVHELRKNLPSLPSSAQGLLRDALMKGEMGFPESFASSPVEVRSHPPAGNGPTATLNPDGGVTWTLPLEVSVNLPIQARIPPPTPPPPAPTAERDAESAAHNGDRPGYRPDFIDGQIVPLPEMTAAQKKNIARIKPDMLAPGQNDTELRYQHFSIVMNKKRRLAFFTAVNIHGESLIGYSRNDKDFYNYDTASTAFAESLVGAEADRWEEDDRIESGEQTGSDYYKSIPNKLQNAKGHTNLDPTPNFDRGHLVRRLDPCWGVKDRALLAEADSFHWTNAAPQTSGFNQGKATKLLGDREGRLWQGIENYILRNAWAADTKLCVFTGPVFDAKDPVYSDKSGKLKIQVPLKFWKVIVWAEAGKLKSLALVADQTRTLQKRKKTTREAAEDLTDPDQLELMQGFLSTVAKVEKLTGFEFGDAIGKADIRHGRQERRSDDPEDLD